MPAGLRGWKRQALRSQIARKGYAGFPTEDGATSRENGSLDGSSTIDRLIGPPSGFGNAFSSPKW